MSQSRVSRREAIAMSLGASLMSGAALRAAVELPLVTRPIPATGEQLPVIGVGTNRFDVTAAPDLEARRTVLEQLPQSGGSVVDTAPLYGRSEAVIGDLVARIGNREKLFLATKIIANDAASAEASLANSMAMLRVQRIDLLQVHNLMGVQAMLPLLQQWKKAGRIRYCGITTSNPGDHPRMMDYMRQLPMDFIQIDYSLGNRAAGDAVLPLARKLGIAVIVNSPFGGRRAAASIFAQVAGKPLPAWAADIQVDSWSQFFLKYVVSHPAVTCAVPGTTEAAHLQDNARAARGTLPDAALRQRMEAFWDGLATQG